MNSPGQTILFLYSELADYFLACIKELNKQEGLAVHVVHWPINQLAPFNFDFPEGVGFYSREGYNEKSLASLVDKINPGLIISSGWMDKGYLKICKAYRNRIPVVAAFDNQWKSSLKQYLAVVSSQFTIHKYFSHAFVPGSPQYAYARKLGFKEDKILTGFYSADVSRFYASYNNSKESKNKNFPNRFIFVGRYVENKGIRDLWWAFMELHEEYPNDWELWCLGKGLLEAEKPDHPKIKHFGFVQPAEMEKFISQTGVFVLPSHFEPWGVVVHEFAAAGFPLICSDEVGAATEFLKDGENGFIFPSGKMAALKGALLKVVQMTPGQLLKMGGKSLELSKNISPAIWAQTILGLLPSPTAE